MKLNKTKNSHTRLIAKLHSNESSSRITNIVIEKINTDKKWKVIGFLDSMSVYPHVENTIISTGEDTVVSVEVSKDFTKDVALEKIVSFVQSLGVDGISVSYSTNESKKISDMDSGECEVYIDTSEYDFINSEDVENIAKKIEAGDQSEFELILTNPWKNGGKSRPWQSSKNLLSSMRKYRSENRSRHQSAQHRYSDLTNKFLNNKLRQTRDAVIQTRLPWWARFYKCVAAQFLRLKNLRFKHFKTFFNRSWKSLKQIKISFVESPAYCCSNHRVDMRNANCTKINHAAEALPNKLVDRAPKSIPTQTEVCTQTPAGRKYRFPIFQRKRGQSEETEYRKCFKEKVRKKSSESSNSKETCSKCTKCSCCSQCSSKSAESPAFANARPIPQTVYTPFQNTYSLNQPVFYVIPASDMNRITNRYPIRDEVPSKEIKCNTTNSSSTTYSSMSSKSSSVEEKESTKEKVTVYVEKDKYGNNRTCKRKVKSIRQIKIINAPISPKVVRKQSPPKKYEELKPVTDVVHNNPIEKKSLENQLIALNKINEEKFKFMKQLEDLNKKLDELTALKNRQINEKCTVEEQKPKFDQESMVKTVDIGILCTQLVDTGVECVMGVDAFSEYDEPRSFVAEPPEKVNNSHESKSDEEKILSFETYSVPQEERLKKGHPKSEFPWELPHEEERYHYLDDVPKIKSRRRTSSTYSPRKYSFVPPLKPERNQVKKKNREKKNSCSFFSSIFGGGSKEKQLVKQQKEITEIRKLIEELNNEIRREAENGESLEEDTDEETIQFSFSRPNAVKKSVTFRNPLVE